MVNTITLNRRQVLEILKGLYKGQLSSSSEPESETFFEIVLSLEDFLADDVDTEQHEKEDDYEEEEEEEGDEEEEEPEKHDHYILIDTLLDLPKLCTHQSDCRGKRVRVEFDGGPEGVVDLVDEKGCILAEDVRCIRRTGKMLEIATSTGSYTFTVKRFPPEWTAEISQLNVWIDVEESEPSY